MNWLLQKISSHWNKPAIICQDKTYLYRELYHDILLCDERIKKIIKKHSVVALLSDYSFESIALFIALYLNKNIIVPIVSKKNIEGKIKESYCEYIIDPKLFFVDMTWGKEPGQSQLINKLKEKGNSGLVIFSSGMTNKPKVMLHDLDNMIDNYKDKKVRDTVIILFLLFDHLGGLNTMFNCIASGSTMVVLDNREPEYVCSQIEKHKVNILPTSPTFLNLILISGAYKKYDMSSLMLITYGTEFMSETLLLKLKKAFSHVKFLQTFGTSEVGIMKTTSGEGTYMKIDGQHKIVNGELWIKTSTQILGYTNHPMDQFEDGWFKTGDLVEEKDGSIKIIGRIKNTINVGGEKVNPSEVEEVLMQIEEVENCIVYGVKNPILGNVVEADVVLTAGYVPLVMIRHIKDFCKDKLQPYKIPVKINFVDEIKYNERFKKIK